MAELLTQDDLSALFAGLSEVQIDTTIEAEPTACTENAVASEMLGQDDIDKLLAMYGRG
jgi:hypothetical protein